MDRLSLVDVFREIAQPNFSGNAEAQERLRETRRGFGPALEKFGQERGSVLENFALAAITLSRGYIDPEDIEGTVKNTNLDDFGDIFVKLALGLTKFDIVRLGYPSQEIIFMISTLTAAGIFDAGRNDLYPDVIELLGDTLRHQPPSTLAPRRIRQLFGK